MSNFDALAMEHGSGYMSYDQGDSLEGNSLTNAYIRANKRNAGGVCLGLSMAFLLWTKKEGHRQPMLWISDFLTQSRASYYDTSSGLIGVTELQMLIATIAESQRATRAVAHPPPGNIGSAATIGSAARNGMWGKSLRATRSITVSWNARDVTAQVFPRLNDPNFSWVFGCYKLSGGGHAMALTSMVHPKTGTRLLVFFEPNHGVVQFQGITAGAKLRQFLEGYMTGEGRVYNGDADIYEFM